MLLQINVRVTPCGVGQAGADALGDGGLDGHEGAKAGSVSWAANDTRQVQDKNWYIWSRSGMAKTGHRGNAREVTYAKISARALKALSLINILNHSNTI